MAVTPENASTDVFWYIDDCKVPEDIGPFFTVYNIKSALNKMGYLGRLAITVYGDFASQKKTFKLLRYAGVDVYDRPAGEFFNFYILIFLSFFFCFFSFFFICRSAFDLYDFQEIKI